MKILITGISGFIGRYVGEYLVGHGHSVYGTSRRPEDEKIRSWWVKDVYLFRLGEPFDQGMLAGKDAVIHLAHDFRAGRREENVAGTLSIARAAEACGIKQQVFVSSYSARSDAVSEYGQTKFAIEMAIREVNGIVVRPGLVIGPGGIFGRIVDLVRSMPILPLIGGGRGEVPVIGIQDLARAMSAIIGSRDRKKEEFNLFYREMVSLKDLLEKVKCATSRRTIMLPVPATLVMLILYAAKKMMLQLPVSEDNVKGFMINQKRVYDSNLDELLSDVTGIDRALEMMVNA